MGSRTHYMEIDVDHIISGVYRWDTVTDTNTGTTVGYPRAQDDIMG